MPPSFYAGDLRRRPPSRFHRHLSPGAIVSGLVLLTVLGIIFGPFLVIWAINTLFGTMIGYTWGTWAAMVILGGVPFIGPIFRK